MANNFSGDPDCVALWKLENNVQDSIGGNDLTAVNSPAYSSSDKKEGSYALDLERNSYQYGAIDDDDLDSGFPGKSGTSEQSFSICLWLKPESIPGTGNTYGVVSKFVSGSFSYSIIENYAGKIVFYIGYNGGGSVSYITFDTAMTAGKWYHLAIAYDASDNGMKIRVWDDDAGDYLDDDKEGTAGGDMSPDSAALEIGRSSGNNSLCFDGLIDEVVFFKDVLTDDEIDQIRAGTYGAATEKSSADSGSGADATEALVTETDKSSSDAGSGAEGTPLAGAALTGTESGSGLEALISRLLSDGESGGAAEDAELDTQEPPRELFSSEEAEGTDRLVAKTEMPTKGGGMKLWI